MPKISGLFLYPVKSLAGISVPTFEVDDFGPRGDRRWMIVDSERRFVTQRTHPELARITTKISGDSVSISIPGEGDFTLTVGDQSCRVNVWGDWVPAIYGAPVASEALSRFCNSSLRLVYMPDDSFRRVDLSNPTEYRRVSFADGFPFLVVNAASLGELNNRLAQPVEMARFRPNIIVDGLPAWQEDQWRTINIGSVKLSLVKPCSRCVVTTVDPALGVKSEDLQPLRTLGTYRRTDDGVMFGVNGIHENIGRISVTDPVTIE